MLSPHTTIIAGPNGSGKTTFTLQYLLLKEQPFLNADEIAKEISPEDVSKVQLRAGKEYFKRNLVNDNDNFEEVAFGNKNQYEISNVPRFETFMQGMEND